MQKQLAVSGCEILGDRWSAQRIYAENVITRGAIHEL
jgi:hypothetical protein